MFAKKINRRIIFTVLFMIFLFVLIVGKVFYIQVFSYRKLESLTDDLWSRNLPIAADRGLILDRNGIVLADNITTVSLVLIPSQIVNKEEVSKILAEILNVSYDEIYEHVSKNVSIERVHPEGRGLSYDIADRISSYHYDGVYLVKESKRYYPYENMLSHVLGYVGIDNQGLSGLELQYDDILTGEDGAIQYYSDAKGNKLEMDEVYQEPTSGMNLSLTIDINIQKSLERELDNAVSMFNPDMALAVVMDPNTGEILGMSSRPNYNPNSYQDYSMETLSRNLPIWSSYEPGSTFKIVTMSAAVNEGIIDIFNDHFYDSGKVRVDTATIKCWKSAGHGDQTFLQVLQNSCNPGFVKLGQMLGKETLFDYIERFGFGEKTGIDLQGEGTGIIFDLEDVGNIELATSAFGQGVSVTPIQQITAVSAAINGGSLYKPYIVKSIVEPATGSIVENHEKEFVRTVISEEASEIMRYALETVVALGGGRSAYIDGYRIGGKTGTAQKAVNGQYLVNNYIMSFVGIVPSNNPEAVLYIALDNPKNTALLSSYTTTPIARRILLDIIDALDIERQPDQVEKDYEWYDDVYVEVPDVVGKSLKEAKALLKDFTPTYTGDGEKVIEQSPEAGERIPKGSVVRLLLE